MITEVNNFNIPNISSIMPDFSLMVYYMYTEELPIKFYAQWEGIIKVINDNINLFNVYYF